MLVERLVGESAEPDKVVTAARGLGERALPAFIRLLTEMLAAPVQIDIETVELGRIADVFAVEDDVQPLTVAAAANSPDALLLSMDADAVSLTTGLMFGAAPEAGVMPINRPLSAVELRVAALAFATVAEAMNGAGARAMQVRFPLPAPIVGADRRKQVHRDGPSARIVYRVATPGGAGRFCVTMPQRVVLTRRGDDKPAGGDWQARLGGEVMRSKVGVEATVGLGKLTLGDIAALAVGQVLEMPASAPANTRLSSRGKTLFVCEFGKLGEHYTVRVRHPFDPNQDLIEGLMPS